MLFFCIITLVNLSKLSNFYWNNHCMVFLHPDKYLRWLFWCCCFRQKCLYLRFGLFIPIFHFFLFQLHSWFITLVMVNKKRQKVCIESTQGAAKTIICNLCVFFLIKTHFYESVCERVVFACNIPVWNFYTVHWGLVHVSTLESFTSSICAS